MFPLLAEAAQKLTPLQKIENVSGQFWLKLILAVIAIALLLFVLKKIAAMNKIILCIIIFAVCAIVGFNWIYERNEPEWATPFVSTLAQWFPSKGAYEGKQQQDPGNPGIRKNAPNQKPAPTTPTPTPNTPPAPAKK